MKAKRFLLAALLLLASSAPALGTAEITVANDRWPDASSLESFGEGAARLMNATTNEEKAIALFRFIQQTTVIIGAIPAEPAYGITDVVYPEKLLNVYGAHWCDGQSRIMESVWRSMGYRGEKLYKFGHTLADIQYRDTDGLERWHVFDNSAYHWFLWDRTGTHLATPEELALDQSLSSRPSKGLVPSQTSLPVPSYIHESHLKPINYSSRITLRNHESVNLSWNNIGKPYYLMSGDDVGGYDFEHGPYNKTYGNAVWKYRPDLSEVSYADGMHAAPVHLGSFGLDGLRPNIRPSAVGVTGVMVYRFAFPHIISDAWIDGEFVRGSANDTITISISNDGVNWKAVWNASATGNLSMSGIPLNERFDIYDPYPSGLVTPFGHYSYLVKIELTAGRDATSVGIDNLSVTTVTQHNVFSLPMLWPVRNTVSVSGSVSSDTSLRITYSWDDLRGPRENVVVVEEPPYSYQVLADGTAWEDVKSKSLFIEAVPRIGSGNKVLLQEGPPANLRDVAPRDAFETTSIVGRWPVPTQKDTASYVQDIRDGLRDGDYSKVHSALHGLGVLRDPAAEGALREVIYHDTSYKYYTKYYALQALYLSIGNEAVPVMVDVLERDPSIGYADVTGEFDNDTNWLWNAQLAAFILAQANTTDARGNVSLIADLVNTSRLQQRLGGRSPSSIYRWTEIRWGLIKDIGVLGDQDEVPLLVQEITPTYTGESSYVTAWALGEIGDKSAAPAVRNLMRNAVIQGSSRMKVLNSIEALGKIGSASDAPGIIPYLNHWDENLRGYAATAIGGLGNKSAIPYLENALAVEEYPWVRAAIQTSITRLNAPQSLEGDVNRDGAVNLQDLVLVASNVGKAGFDPRADLAAPLGAIDLFDVMAVVRNWGRTG